MRLNSCPRYSPHQYPRRRRHLEKTQFFISQRRSIIPITCRLLSKSLWGKDHRESGLEKNLHRCSQSFPPPLWLQGAYSEDSSSVCQVFWPHYHLSQPAGLSGRCCFLSAKQFWKYIFIMQMPFRTIITSQRPMASRSWLSDHWPE